MKKLLIGISLIKQRSPQVSVEMASVTTDHWSPSLPPPQICLRGYLESTVQQQDLEIRNKFYYCPGVMSHLGGGWQSWEEKCITDNRHKKIQNLQATRKANSLCWNHTVTVSSWVKDNSNRGRLWCKAHLPKKLTKTKERLSMWTNYIRSKGILQL